MAMGYPSQRTPTIGDRALLRGDMCARTGWDGDGERLTARSRADSSTQTRRSGVRLNGFAMIETDTQDYIVKWAVPARVLSQRCIGRKGALLCARSFVAGVEKVWIEDSGGKLILSDEEVRRKVKL